MDGKLGVTIMRTVRLVTAICLAIAPVAGMAEIIDVSRCSDRQSVSLTTDDVAMIRLRDGRSAVFQFTGFGQSEANYRWRFHASSKHQPVSGTGRVFEQYERTAVSADRVQVRQQNRDEDLRMKAGTIWAEWSHHTAQSGWVYYCPELAELEVLPSTNYKW